MESNGSEGLNKQFYGGFYFFGVVGIGHHKYGVETGNDCDQLAAESSGKVQVFWEVVGDRALV